MRRKISTITLITLIVLMLTTMSFAGTWFKLNFSEERIGTGWGANSTSYTTEAVVTSGNPSINFRVYGGSYGDIIKVEMQKKDYVAGQGWVFKTVSTYSDKIHSSNSYVSFWDSSVRFSNDECRFIITPDSSSVNVEGYVHYFKN
ncbi:hypothetical protein R9X47_24430 [Wukongibacter baidiensis]|uniref:hypothetical protein n=1 Tax=Wukongibacter baidiensis TaxID=1723361 RepID=UPI003D7F6529